MDVSVPLLSWSDSWMRRRCLRALSRERSSSSPPTSTTQAPTTGTPGNHSTFFHILFVWIYIFRCVCVGDGWFNLCKLISHTSVCSCTASAYLPQAQSPISLTWARLRLPRPASIHSHSLIPVVRNVGPLHGVTGSCGEGRTSRSPVTRVTWPWRPATTNQSAHCFR